MSDEGAISLRLATADDADTVHAMIVALAETLGDERKVVSTVEDIRSYGFAQRPAFEALLAELDGRPVGLCLFFYSFSTWLGTLGVYIQDLYVDEVVRGAGVGRMLVTRTARIAASHGANHLRLAVDTTNADAQAFYEQIGLQHRHDEYIYQASGPAFRALAASDDETGS